MKLLFFSETGFSKNVAARRAPAGGPAGGVFFARPGARRAPTVFLKMPEVGKQFCENIALGVPGLRQTFSVLALDLFRSSTQKVCQNSSPVIFYRTFNFTG